MGDIEDAQKLELSKQIIRCADHDAVGLLKQSQLLVISISGYCHTELHYMHALQLFIYLGTSLE